MGMHRSDHEVTNILYLGNIVDIRCIVSDPMHLIREDSHILLERPSADSSIVWEINPFGFPEIVYEFIDVGSLFFIFFPMILFFRYICFTLEFCLFHEFLFLELFVLSVHPSEDLLRFVFGELIQGKQEICFDVSE